MLRVDPSRSSGGRSRASACLNQNQSQTDQGPGPLSLSRPAEAACANTLTPFIHATLCQGKGVNVSYLKIITIHNSALPKDK